MKLLTETRLFNIIPGNKDLQQYVPAEDSFAKGLYIIDIGKNDLALAQSNHNQTLDEVLDSIPKILARI